MFFYLFGQILKGKSVWRALLNKKAGDFFLRGKVIDIGGGKNPSYFNFFGKDENIVIENIDLNGAKGSRVLDLEKEKLPAADNSKDQALLFNILEHIYNHQRVAGEAFRILKNGGELIGAVPFLINVHPDPHDYFRYTKESLEKIFAVAGFREVKIAALGFGPFMVNYNNMMFFLPRIIRPLFLFFYFSLDFILLKIKPGLTERFPLGYFFSARK
jgi:SAM-dependent methyltransferase